MIVEAITEFQVVGVFDRNSPNLERIALQANESINTGQYGIMLGIKGENGSAFPIKDNLYWFGDGYIQKGDWVYLYTGLGKPTTSELPNNKNKIYTVHWGRESTILYDVNVVPILFRVDAINIQPTVNLLTHENKKV